MITEVLLESSSEELKRNVGQGETRHVQVIVERIAEEKCVSQRGEENVKVSMTVCLEKCGEGAGLSVATVAC